MTDRERMKQQACQRAAAEVQDGMVLGLGTGTTVYYFLQELGRMVQQGLRIVGVPTSQQTAQLAVQWAIPLATLEDYPVLDLVVDGADEVDPELNLVKGAGGALLREKIVAVSGKRRLIVVDDGKLVQHLGERYPIPVEIVPFGHSVAQRALEALGARVVLRRQDDGQPRLSDNGNYLMDCHFGPIAEPRTLQKHLLAIPTLIDSGLFLGLADTVIIGQAQGVRLLER